MGLILAMLIAMSELKGFLLHNNFENTSLLQD